MDSCTGESTQNTDSEVDTSAQSKKQKDGEHKVTSEVISGRGNDFETTKVKKYQLISENREISDTLINESSPGTVEDMMDKTDESIQAKSKKVADADIGQTICKETIKVLFNDNEDRSVSPSRTDPITSEESSPKFLSPEEKEAVSHLALSQITKELDKRILAKELSKRKSAELQGGENALSNVDTDNAVAAEDSEIRLYTGPYGRIHSPFKKFSSYHGFPSGVKRRKSTGPAAKRSKLFHEENSAECISEDSPDKELSSPVYTPVDDVKDGSWEDTSDDDEKLAIVEEESISEFDKKMEDKSSKFSLSVVNVKSIIHKIVTNENVIEMVRKAVQQEMDEHDLKYEPKMTRSKLKEFEAQGHVPTNWGLSPRKKRESPNFLEMELPEDEEEDDEDFNPEKVVQESDEDSESVLSSCLSDIGSPMPSTPSSMPSTPSIMPSHTASTPTSQDTEPITHDDNSSQSFLSPMGPPLQTNVPKSQHKTSSGLGKKFHDAMEKERRDREEEAELIASRTRSKYPLTDCSILDLEANFVAPDITQDMYETCDDYDWKEFLSTLIRFPGDDDTLTNNLNTTNEDEDTEDDPEYNFQAEVEMLEFDQEDYRDDRAVKVSKKEMNELIDDILNNDNDDDTIDEKYKINIKTQSEKIVFNSNTKKRTEYQQSLISAIGQHERKQIDDQLRKHVQQLAQTYMMAQTGKEEHEPVADVAKFYLNELNSFADRSQALYGRTTFRVCSLEPALHLLDSHTWVEPEQLSQQDAERLAAVTFKYDAQLLPAFSYKQMVVIWTSPVFMYPDLLPHGRFFKQVDIKKDRARVKFLESEDNLLAMGLAQFSHLRKDAKDYIQRFMLPCKSRKQIEIRIKNLNAKVAKDNAVKFFKTYKVLPRFPQYAPEFDVSMMKSLQGSRYDWNELPLWCRFFSKEERSALNESVRKQIDQQREIKRRRRERQSASFSLSDSDMIPLCTPPQPSASAPVTPHHDTDSSVSASSGSDSNLNLRHVKRKRPRRQSRKRLNMDQGQKKSGMEGKGASTQGAFTPIILSGNNFGQPTQHAPLTICVVDNVQCVNPLSTTGGPHIGTVPGIPMATCATPTIVVINKNTPLHVQSLNTNVQFTLASTSSHLYTQSGNIPLHTTPAYTQSNVTTQSVKSDSASIKSFSESESLTFEDICRPILESEMASASQTDINHKELCTLYTENGSVVNLNNLSDNVIVNVVENVTSKTKTAPNTNANPVSRNVSNVASSSSQSATVQNQVISESEVQSSEISSTVLNNHMETDSETPSNVLERLDQDEMVLPLVANEFDVEQEMNVSQKETVSSTGEQQRETTISDTLQTVCNCTPPVKTNPTNTSPASVKSGEKTPKSSLEIMASLAPYFISPIHGNAPLQKVLETTPTKRPLPNLAPKSVSPCQKSSPISFDDLSRVKRKPRLKTSPRKKHLQQQVKTILPKGFVGSAFDTSPAKKAASDLVNKAKQRVNQSKGFCKILPRPANSADGKQEIQLIKGTRRGLARKFSGNKNVNKDTDQTKELHKEGDMLPNDTEEVNDDTDDLNDDENAAIDDDDDDAGGDTESDYTQSEDGNETQGTDDGEVTQGTDDGEDLDIQVTDDGEDIESQLTDDADEDIDTQVTDDGEDLDTQGTDDGDDGEDIDAQMTDDGEDIDTQVTDDGEVTQGTDGDSQESQEEDNLIDDLTAPRTTVGFAARRDDLFRRSQLKKDRNRELTVALLDPDIVEADPQRDLRDTLFAQSYIHKVKKSFREDVDKLEQFLKIMYHFSQDSGSPVELYTDLQELFSGHPDLIHDFAGFLQPEQAVECGCYMAYKEFVQARTFLRKLEIYFNKNPNQLQKVMRTFSRWYKKPGRKESDLREQIEPMLKGQKLLLDEFSKFFPNERPSESLMDDFEEINLDDSVEIEDKDTSFEEIELLDMEEVYGTKRCVCGCHSDGDDTYKKRKKHCYKCCLTVIDGELVYKVNKSTIKKISVTYGPPVKLSTLKSKDQSDDGKSKSADEVEDPDNTSNIDGVEKKPDDVSNSRDELTEQEPANVEWLLDHETAEKENIEHYDESSRNESESKQKKAAKTKSPANKESFLQRISKLSRNQPQDKSARLSSVIKGMSPSPSSKEGEQLSEPAKQTEDMEVDSSENEQNIDSEIQKENADTGANKNRKDGPTNVNTEVKEANTVEHLQLLNNGNSSVQKQDSNIHNSLRNEICSEEKDTAIVEASDKLGSDNTTVVGETSAIGKQLDTKERSGVSGDILASAFTSALNTEVSMDTSSCFPFSLFDSTSKLSDNKTEKEQVVASQISNLDTAVLSAGTTTHRPTVVQSVVVSTHVVAPPSGQSNLNISSGSSFQKVPSADNITAVSHQTENDEETKNKQEVNAKEDDSVKLVSKQVSKVENVTDRSTSPPFSSFLPFSPFAQEIQSITSVPSPLSAVQNPGIVRSLSSSGKVRRITPIPVKGEDSKTDSQLSFQTAIENSPVLPDLPVPSPDNSLLTSCKSVDNAITLAAYSGDNKGGGSEENKITLISYDSQADSKTVLESSQKSSGSNPDNSSSLTSVISDSSFARKTISQPEIFSENANVSFPKVNTSVSNSSLGHSGILSEESLFHCLSKPPNFSETIPNVSNLTNLLNALDGQSQGIPVQEQNDEGVSGQNISACLNNNTDIVTVTEQGTGSLTNSKIYIEEEKATDKEKLSETGKLVDETSASQCSVDSEEGSDNYYTQSVDIEENLKRIKAGLFKVSRLSDSDTSGISTPSTSATSVLVKNTANDESVKQNIRQKGDIAVCGPSKDIEENKTIEMDKELNTDSTRLKKQGESSNEKKRKENESDSTTDTEGQGRRKKRKMSRRELRRSLQGKEVSDRTSSFYSVNDSDRDKFDKDGDSETCNTNPLRNLDLPCKTETEYENITDLVNLKESDKGPESVTDKTQAGIPAQDVNDSGKVGERLLEIKTEDTKSVDSDCLAKNVQCVSDSETSSKGHKKSKHKHKSDKERSRKKKKRKDNKDSPKSERRKVSKRKRLTEQDLEKTEDIAPQCTAERKDVLVQPSGSAQETTQVLSDNQGDSNVAQSSGEQNEVELEWTKEIDKMILESCKVNGIKEKTFARIAKRIGNVTSMQVRKRFEHLYGMIFGIAYGEKSD